jgi:pyruvate ferredoxin oxidoreductase delta subunit
MIIRERNYKEIPIGGVIEALPTRLRKVTGDWREQKPVYDEKLCFNCLLCWVRCPDSTIVIEVEAMKGFNYDWCKGCGICADICPSGAIEMTPEGEENK